MEFHHKEDTDDGRVRVVHLANIGRIKKVFSEERGINEVIKDWK